MGAGGPIFLGLVAQFNLHGSRSRQIQLASEGVLECLVEGVAVGHVGISNPDELAMLVDNASCRRAAGELIIVGGMVTPRISELEQ